MEIVDFQDNLVASEIYDLNPFSGNIHFINVSPIEKSIWIKANIDEAKPMMLE